MNEATKEQLAEEKNSDGKRSKLQQEIFEQKKLIETSVSKHRASELALRKVSFFSAQVGSATAKPIGILI